MINNVTINGLLPGPFNTDRVPRASGPVDPDRRGITVDQLLAERAKLNPAGRFGDPEEFGQACVFLCGANPGFITGQNILLDGGAFPGTLYEGGLVRASGSRARGADLWRDADAGGRPGRSPGAAGGVRRQSAYVGRRGGSYRTMEYPRVIPNSDGAGIVDQVGDGVTRLKAGQRVWLFNGQRNGRAFGTAAEYIALAEHLVMPLPDNLSFAERRHPRHPRMTAWTLPLLRWPDRRTRRRWSPAAPAPSATMPCNLPNGAAPR